MEIQMITIKDEGIFAVLQNTDGLYLHEDGTWLPLGKGMVRWRIYESPIYNYAGIIKRHFAMASGIPGLNVAIVPHFEIVYVPPSD